MQPDIDDMLGLTADIAEELLCLKDTGGRVSVALADKISRLAALAQEGAAQTECEYADVVEDTDDNNMAAIPASVSVADEGMDGGHDYFDCVDENGLTQEADHDMSGNATYDDEKVQSLTAEGEPRYIPNGDALSSVENVPSPESARNASVAINRGMLKKAFSLNDVFLYRRLLFKGSAQDFNDVLELIPSLQSTDELRQMLSGRYGVDLKSEEAKDFIETVLPYIDMN